MSTHQFPISTHMHIKTRDFAIITRTNQNPNEFKNNHHINEYKYRFTIFPSGVTHKRKQDTKRMSFKETTLEEIPPRAP